MSTPRPASGPGGPMQPGRPRPLRPGGGPPGHALMLPVEKSKDFKGAIKRLVGMLKPEHSRIFVVLVLGVVSVTFAVLGPKILGNATNVLFSGVISKQLPAGVTQAQAVAALRAKGENRLAEMLSAMHLNPGHGVDFGALERILLTLVAIYLASAAFSWMQQYTMAGVAQRTVYRLRQRVDEKLARLPLKYFDEHARGDVLSRMTNDIDNI
jgi:ATP-binding cassette subfamily B multidrug efflux pump